MATSRGCPRVEAARVRARRQGAKPRPGEAQVAARRDSGAAGPWDSRATPWQGQTAGQPRGGPRDREQDVTLARRDKRDRSAVGQRDNRAK